MDISNIMLQGAQNPTDTWIAVNPVNSTCTHQGCTVEWQNEENIFFCPCHAAKYDSKGEVLAQPAPSPLTLYEAISEQGKVLVKI